MSEVALAGVRGFRQVDEVVREPPAAARADMRVPARVFADRELIGDRGRPLARAASERGDAARDHRRGARDARHPPGLRLPGRRRGRDEPPDGVISPGGVGYDINCGVRLLALPLTGVELGERREPLVHELSRRFR